MTARKFIVQWGELGSVWGISRSVAQVQALLYVAPGPLHADEISQLLGVSRSNVSTSLRELIGWGVVRRVHAIGDRRDKFESIGDVVDTFRAILHERKRREVDPTMVLLEECLRETTDESAQDVYLRQRLIRMREFLDVLSRWYDQIEGLSKESLEALLDNGSLLLKVLHNGSNTPVEASTPPEP